MAPPSARMRFYDSKLFILAHQAVLVLGGTVLLAGSIALLLRIRRDDLGLIVALLVAAATGLGIAVLGWMHGRQRLKAISLPIFKFHAASVACRSAPKQELKEISLSSITGVECAVYTTSESYAAWIKLQLWSAQDVTIDISNSAVPPQEVFAAFKEHLPHLVQPRGDLLRLFHPRYAHLAALPPK